MPPASVSSSLGQSLPLPNHNGVKSLTTGQPTGSAGHQGFRTMGDTCFPQCSARQQQTERLEELENNMNLRVAVVCGVLCSSLPPCGNKRAKLSNKKIF